LFTNQPERGTMVCTMYKFTRIQYCVASQFFGGGVSIETTVCWSTSPKRACSLQGVRSTRFDGDADGNIVCTIERLERNGKLVYELQDY
jgi:hypothetical protein